jgi:hypothetical protein
MFSVEKFRSREGGNQVFDFVIALDRSMAKYDGNDRCGAPGA